MTNLLFVVKPHNINDFLEDHHWQDFIAHSIAARDRLPAESRIAPNVWLVSNEIPFDPIADLIRIAKSNGLTYRLTILKEPIEWFLA